MKIAIVGTGISGLVSAALLHREHDLTLFEGAGHIGGHSHTVEAEQAGRRYALDTGFLVYNEANYPYFSRLLAELGVETQPAPMSFSVRREGQDFEYCGTNLNTVFARRRNLLNPAFHRLIGEILRFNREGKAFLVSGADSQPLGEFLASRGFSPEFAAHYLVPMSAAIWSVDPASVMGFPAATLLRFFENHHLLSAARQLPWRTVTGGSRRYVERLAAPIRDRIRLLTPVRSVRRLATHVEITPHGGDAERFDHVIIAAHSDQALAMLADPNAAEREVLGAIRYQPNEAVLHTDVTLLPRRRRAWASWNYHIPEVPLARSTVTYNLSLLQTLDSPLPFCLTLNRSEAVDPACVLGRYHYEHPCFDQAAIEAQRRRGEINGVRRTHFCGAYWGYGFHEDGVNSALAVARDFGLEM